MSKIGNKTFIFERDTSVYTFSKNPLQKNFKAKHIFLPWGSKIDKNLMFQIKKSIQSDGSTHIPIYSDDQKDIVSHFDDLSLQVSRGIETLLVLTNFESIHLCRIKTISIDHNQKTSLNMIPSLMEFVDRTRIIVEVDDLYVLEVNHLEVEKSVLNKLNIFINSTQRQNTFEPFKSFYENLEDKTLTSLTSQRKWVDIDRSLTYQYFIKRKYLIENVFFNSWDFLSLKAQHFLVLSSIECDNAIFLRDVDKWKALKISFYAYKSALTSELNNVYIRPLINAIVEYPVLNEAWVNIQDSTINPKINNIIKNLVKGERLEIDSFEEFLFYIQNAKSFLFTLKNKFIKKIYKEEFLILENFLNKQESLIESFSCRNLNTNLERIVDIDSWINNCSKNIDYIDHFTIEKQNLDLSHLLGIMLSLNYEDNVFYKLIEEKSAKTTTQKSFSESVKSLTSQKKKAA